MTVAIRPLAADDLDWAAALLAATGLPSRQPELQRHLALEPNGFSVAEDDGRPVGLGGYIAYDAFAFVGNMAVAPQAQGRGVGGALLARLLGTIERRGIPATLLEATPDGERLYRRRGFLALHPTLAYTRAAGGPGGGAGGGAVLLRPEDLDAVAAFDAPRFGADRRRVLARLLADCPGRGLVVRQAGGAAAGYLIAQGRILGPMVADGPAAAEALLAAALALPFDGPPTAFVPEPNVDAAAVFGRQGFAAQVESLRMRRGGAGPAGRPASLYGLAALAIG
jgi:GNAT superfamily N-acetyltransferase